MPKSPLAALDTKALRREILRRRRRAEAVVRRLRAKHDRLLKQVREVEGEIAAHRKLAGGFARRDGAWRNETSLANTMAKLLARATMSVTQMVGAVQKAGYRTNSPNFRTIVNQTLIKDKRFKRVSRGKYTAK